MIFFFGCVYYSGNRTQYAIAIDPAEKLTNRRDAGVVVIGLHVPSFWPFRETFCRLYVIVGV